MFCPSCGAEYTQKLRYCKQCGENLSPPASTVEVKVPRLRLTGMFWAIVVFGMTGLALAFTGLLLMWGYGARGDELLIPFVFSLLMISAISGLLIWQLARLVSAYQQLSRNPSFERPAINEPRQAQLATPPEAAPSVIEHTTRQFAPAYKEPSARE